MLRLAAVASASLVLGACGGPAPEPTAPTPAAQRPGAGPSEALEALLDRVQRDDAYRGSGFRSGDEVTANFISAVDELAGPNGGLEFDPFLCAQQLPQRIEYVDESVEGDRARVTALQRYGPGVEETQTYDLVLEDGAWKLDRSECAG